MAEKKIEAKKVEAEVKKEKPKADMSDAAKRAWVARRKNHGSTGISKEGTEAIKKAAEARKLAKAQEVKKSDKQEKVAKK